MYLRILIITISALLFTGCSQQDEPPGLPDWVNSLNKPLECKRGMIVEFFAYQCPHCYKLEEYQDELKKVSSVLVKLPTDLGRTQFRPYLQLHHAVDLLKLDQGIKHEAMRLYHEEGKQISSEGAVQAWLVKNGANPDRVLKLFREQSELLDSRIAFGHGFFAKANVTSVPTLLINGRYITSPADAGGYDNLIPHIKKLQELPHNCSE